MGISQSTVALQRWFLNVHERASVATTLKEMYGFKDSDQVTHKEAAPKRVKRNEDDVRKLGNCFTSGLVTNPFSDDAA